MDSRDPLTICAIGYGSDSHVQNRVQCFADRGHKVFLITDRKVGLPKVDEILLSPLVKIPQRYRILHGLGLVGGLFKLFRSINPDIVHVHYAYQHRAWLNLILDYRPLVVSLMGGDILFDERETRPPRGIWLTKKLLERADLISAKSEFLLSAVDEWCLENSVIMKTVWGIDPGRFRKVESRSLRQTLGLTPNDKVILSPKRLKPLYNVDLIVKAMPQVLQEHQHQNIKLLIAESSRDNEYKDKIEDQVTRLGLQDYVIFCGDIQHADMPQYYSMADIVIGIPTSDGLPQTLIEAMACEVPHMLSRLPRYEEFVTHEQSAYFVDLSTDSIANGLAHLLRNAELRNKIAKNGLQIAKGQFDASVEISRVEEAYYALLARQDRHRVPLKERLMVLLVFLQLYSLDYGSPGAFGRFIGASLDRLVPANLKSAISNAY